MTVNDLIATGEAVVASFFDDFGWAINTLHSARSVGEIDLKALGIVAIWAFVVFGALVWLLDKTREWRVPKERGRQ